MPWGVAAAAVAVAGSAYAANKQSQAAKDAAKTQAGAADSASAAQLQMYNQTRADQSPFREAGLTSLQQYMKLLGLDTGSVQQAQTASQYADPAAAYLAANPDVAADPYYSQNPLLHYQEHGKAEGRTWGAPAAAPVASATPQSTAQAQQDAFSAFRSAPGYQFGLDQGTKAVQASAAARGGLNSGATLKALTKFGQNYADQQGIQPYENRLASLAGVGQTATNTTDAAGQSTATQVGQNTINAGQATAGGIYGSQNAWTNFGNQASGAIGQGFGQLGSLSKQNDFGDGSGFW